MSIVRDYSHIIDPTNIDHKANNRMGHDNGPDSFTTNMKGIDKNTPRHSQYRSNVGGMQNTVNQRRIANAKHTQRRVEIQPDSINKLNRDLLTRSHRKVMQMSSGEYGNFVNMDKIERVIDKLKQHRNHSIQI